MTDPDQYIVYQAELASGIHARSQRLTLKEAQQFAEDVLTDSWTRRYMPGLPHHVNISMGNGMSSWAVRDDVRIRLNKGHGDCKSVLLHELAHLATSDGHGPRWRMAYLFMVRRYLGIMDWADLSYEFKKSGLSLSLYATNVHRKEPENVYC